MARSDDPEKPLPRAVGAGGGVVTNGCLYWLHRGAEEWCYVDSDCYDTVREAIDGDAAQLNARSYDELTAALDALDGCARDKCDGHAAERGARRLLDALIDERDAADADGGDCSRCGVSGACPECSGVPNPTGGY